MPIVRFKTIEQGFLVVFELITSGMSPRYLEKSPPNAAKFPFLQEMFKEAHKTVFVAILRHPIAILRKRFFGFGGKMRQYRTKEKLRRSLEDRLGCWYVRGVCLKVVLLKNAITSIVNWLDCVPH